VKGTDMFTIEMLPAYHGDSLWIEWGDASAPRRMLIDGGLVGTYKAIVKRAGSPCRLELFCVTHVDQDHVEGAVKLLANLPKQFCIDEVWFNGWNQITGRLGARQGEELGAAIVMDKLNWNGKFQFRAAMVPDSGELPRLELPDGLTLTVLSPGAAELAALMPVWEKECVKAGLKPGDIRDATEALEQDKRLRPRLGSSINVESLATSAYAPDSSPANGSSIALLAEFDGKSILLNADAHSEVLEKSISRLLTQRDKNQLRLDAVKVAHHGSMYNTSRSFLGLVDCPKWLFSTNGDKFYHPDRETIARILCSRRNNRTELYFNYRSEYNEVWGAPYLQKRWHYRASFPDSDEGGGVVDLCSRN
jgi:beta-lactamase superfamily II metal-dependent hydrolase